MAAPRLLDVVRGFEEHLDVVQRMLRRHGVPDADLEDLAQEVFIVMWRRWDEFDQRRSLAAWLAGIALNVARSHLRRPRPEIPLADLEAVDQSPTGEDGLTATRTRRFVLAALDRLPDEQRSLLVLRDVDGLHIREIAALFDVPLFTAYTRVRRARIAFARAVRRLQSRSAQGKSRASGLEPAALLALERTAAPAVDAAARARILARARAWSPPPAPAVASSSRPPVATPASSTGWPTPLLTTIAFVVVVALPLAMWALPRSERRAGAPAQATAASSPSSPRSGPVFAATRAGPRSPAPGPAPLLLTAAEPPAPPEDGFSRGLAAYWRLGEDGAGDTIRDRSGRGSDCRLRGGEPGEDTEPAAAVEGRFGTAVDLEGRRWLECPQPLVVDGGPRELTVSLWVDFAGVPFTRSHALLSRQLGDGRQDHLFLGFLGKRLFFSSHSWNVLMSHAPTTGGWRHVAVVRAGDMVTLYVDGRRVGRRTIRQAIRAAVDTPLLIGAGMNTPDQVIERFPGAIDEVAIYDRALSTSELAALAAGAQPRGR
jgi:RNA polymerase sigma-70 factor, ECF subfamily